MHITYSVSSEIWQGARSTTSQILRGQQISGLPRGRRVSAPLALPLPTLLDIHFMLALNVPTNLAVEVSWYCLVAPRSLVELSPPL